MFTKIKTSYELVKASLFYIKRDGELLVYTLFSLLASFAILLTFIGVDFYFIGTINALLNSTKETTPASQAIGYFLLFLYYFIFSFITFFFNTAIITSVQRRNEGKDNKLGDGLKDAMGHLKEIFIWSMINATVSMILKIIQSKFDENSIVGKIIVGMIGGVWNILTFFSFPLMIVNGLGAKDAIKESSKLFKKTWGERAAINVGTGFVFFLGFLLIILLGAFTLIKINILAGISILFFGIIFIVILSTTCDIIIKTILLHYAKTGELPSGVADKINIANIASEK